MNARAEQMVVRLKGIEEQWHLWAQSLGKMVKMVNSKKCQYLNWIAKSNNGDS